MIICLSSSAACPRADIIDLDYGYNNVFHHTPQDTMDKLSPKSIEIVGARDTGDCASAGQENKMVVGQSLDFSDSRHSSGERPSLLVANDQRHLCSFPSFRF